MISIRCDLWTEMWVDSMQRRPLLPLLKGGEMHADDGASLRTLEFGYGWESQ